MRLSLLCAAAIAAAAVAPASVEAANSTVAVGNPSGTTTALVTPERQLQVTIVSPSNVVRAAGDVNGNSCGMLYVPPAGKAVVVTEIAYELGSGQDGTDSSAFLHGASNCADVPADLGETTRPFEARSHTFPTGLPLPALYLQAGGAHEVGAAFTGYLIPVSQLPPEIQQPNPLPMKGMPGWRR